MNGGLAQRLNRYKMTLAPYRVGRTLVWLPPSRGDVIAPLQQSAVAELWEELERTSRSAGNEFSQSDLRPDADVIDLDAMRTRREN